MDHVQQCQALTMCKIEFEKLFPDSAALAAKRLPIFIASDDG